MHFKSLFQKIGTLHVALIWYGVVRMARPPKVDLFPASITLNESRYQGSRSCISALVRLRFTRDCYECRRATIIVEIGL